MQACAVSLHGPESDTLGGLVKKLADRSGAKRIRNSTEFEQPVTTNLF